LGALGKVMLCLLSGNVGADFREAQFLEAREVSSPFPLGSRAYVVE
jgi:hypothetical protein